MAQTDNAPKTKEEINRQLVRYGMNCPICGMQMIDLQHVDYKGEDPDYHEFCCTDCNIDFDVNVGSSVLIDL